MKVKDIYEKCANLEADEITETLNKYCSEVTIHCPHLDKHMRPAAKLLHNSECPRNLNGICHKCDFFVGYSTKDTNGEVFAYMSFPGYCLKKEFDDDNS